MTVLAIAVFLSVVVTLLYLSCQLLVPKLGSSRLLAVLFIILKTVFLIVFVIASRKVQ